MLVAGLSSSLSLSFSSFYSHLHCIIVLLKDESTSASRIRTYLEASQILFAATANVNLLENSKTRHASDIVPDNGQLIMSGRKTLNIFQRFYDFVLIYSIKTVRLDTDACEIQSQAKHTSFRPTNLHNCAQNHLKL